MLQEMVTTVTALGGVGVLLAMVLSGVLPLNGAAPAPVRVRASGRSDGR